MANIVEVNNVKFLNKSQEALIKEAKAYIGKNYVYGGIGTSKECMSSNCTVHKKGKKYKGYDCSGFIYSLLSKWDYNKFGRGTSEMQKSNSHGKWIYNKADLLVGDIIYFNGHCGLVSKIENNKVYMIHATKCGDTIKESDSSYRKDFTKGLRILKTNLTKEETKTTGGKSVMRINVHAGHNPDGKTACGAIGLVKESTENRNVVKELIAILQKEGHTVYDCTVNDGTSVSDVINKIVKKCNSRTVDLDVSIHFNSGANDKGGNGSTTGTEVLVYKNSGVAGSTAKRICERIAKIGYKNRGVKTRTDLGYLKGTKAQALLVECCFVDDKDDINKYSAKTMAKAIAEGILNKTISSGSSSGGNNNNGSFAIGNYNKDVIVSTNDGSSLNARSGRGSEFSKVGSFANGTKVNVWYIDKAKDGSLWGSCSCNGKTAYIHMGYVKAI